jgi:hypothetical protein
MEQSRRGSSNQPSRSRGEEVKWVKWKKGKGWQTLKNQELTGWLKVSCGAPRNRVGVRFRAEHQGGDPPGRPEEETSAEATKRSTASKRGAEHEGTESEWGFVQSTEEETRPEQGQKRRRVWKPRRGDERGSHEEETSAEATKRSSASKRGAEHRVTEEEQAFVQSTDE